METRSFWVAAVNQREIPGEGTFSCEGERAKVTGVVNGIPSPPEPITYTTCGVEQVTLTGSGGIEDQYHWYNANDLLVGEGSTFKIGQVSKNELVDLTASFLDANKTINWYNEQNEKIGEGTAISYRAEESVLLYAKGGDQKGWESLPTIINLNVYTFPDSIQSSATEVKAHEAITFNVAEPTENDHSYDWDFGDGQSSKQKSPAIFYFDGGEFNVELIISNLKKGCYDTLYKKITVNGIAGNDSTITSISPKGLPPEFSIYPNPFHNRLIIKITDQSISQNPINSPAISVYDVLSRNFLRKEDVEITTEGIEINSRDFPSGIYLIKINSRIFKLSKS